MIRPRQIVAEELSYLTINWKGEPASITTPRKVEIAPSTMGTNTCSMAFCILSFLFPSVCRKAWKWSGMEVIEGKILKKRISRKKRSKRDLKWMGCHWLMKTKIVRLGNTRHSLVPGPVRTIRLSGGGLEPRAIKRILPTSLTGDVTFDIAEDDWEQGCTRWHLASARRCEKSLLVYRSGDKLRDTSQRQIKWLPIKIFFPATEFCRRNKSQKLNLNWCCY